MKNKNKFYYFWLLILFSVILSVFLTGCEFSLRKPPTQEKFEIGSKWHSSEPEMMLAVEEDGYFATVIVDGKKYEFDFYGLKGRLYLSYYVEGQDTSGFGGIYEWASGDYCIALNGDMIIRDFECEEMDLYYEEIRLIKSR